MQQIFEFGEFRMDPRERLLLRAGKRVPLTPKAFETLVALVENSGRVVKKEDLMKRVWPDAFVEEVNLAQNVSAVRRALGADAEHYIETVPKLGYRFIVDARAIDPSAMDEIASVELASSQPSVVSPRTQHRKILAIAAAALVVVGLLVLVGLAFRANATSRNATAHIASLAVLPLENLSKDPEQEYFADGMTDELITDLAKISSLRVISRNSVMVYKGQHKPVPLVGRELNVDGVIEGTVMRGGNRVRITAQLIEALTDHHLWAEAYEGDVRDVLKVQEQVAQAIATAIKGKLAPEEQVHLTDARAVDPDAHEADLRGFYELHKHGATGTLDPTGGDIERAIQHFREALTLDPDDALAYAGLAAAYYEQSTFLRAPLEVMPEAKAAAIRAIELDESLAEAHASLGYVKLTFDWDWAGAEHEFRRALELNPNQASGHAGYAHLLLTLGKSEQAIQQIHQLKRIDPLFPQSHVGLPYTLWNLRLYGEAIDAARKEGDERVIALSLVEQGKRDEAVAAAEKSLKSVHNPVMLAQLAYVYARAGMKEKATTILRGIEAQVKQRYVCGFNVACLYAGLGDKERAYTWLEKAYRDRSD